MAINSSRKALKQKLRNRENIFAGWVSLGNAQIAEMYAHAGLDFIGIDIEHSTTSYEECQRIIAASQAYNSLCLPRIDSHSMEMIKRLLDSGADGMIIPMVETKEQVEKIIEWIKYPPLGNRSFGVNRGQNYGFEFDEYISSWNESSSIIIQIESIKGVENIDALLQYDEIDAAMVGPFDLSGSLGIPGQINHPKIQEAANHVIEACKRHGKSCGNQIVSISKDLIQEKQSEGYNFVVLSSDIFMLAEWTKEAKTLVEVCR